MGVTHIPIAEAERDLAAVLERAELEGQIAIDSGAKSFLIQPSVRKGRTISESIRLLEEHQKRTGVIGYMDQDFARDVAEAIAMRNPRKSLYDDEVNE